MNNGGVGLLQHLLLSGLVVKVAVVGLGIAVRGAESASGPQYFGAVSCDEAIKCGVLKEKMDQICTGATSKPHTANCERRLTETPKRETHVRPQRQATAVRGSFFLHSGCPHTRPFLSGLDGEPPEAGEAPSGLVPKAAALDGLDPATGSWIEGTACEGDVVLGELEAWE